MFGFKKIKETMQAVKEMKAIEKSCNKIIDDYFKTNKNIETNYGTNDIAGRFYEFVKSVNERISSFERALENGELVSKEWHDEQVLNANQEIEDLKSKNYALQEEINADNDELAAKDEKIETLSAIIQDQEQQLQTKKGSKKGKKK